jgi:hypothetical protein
MLTGLMNAPSLSRRLVIAPYPNLVVVEEQIGITSGCAIMRQAEDYFVFVRAGDRAVIPG